MNANKNAREAILSRIRQAKRHQPVILPPEPDWGMEPYKTPLNPLDQCFAHELEAVDGKCTIVSSEIKAMNAIRTMLAEQSISSLFCRDAELQSLLQHNSIETQSNPDDFNQMQAGITRCDYLIARTGSVLVSSAHPSGRQMNVFPPVHIVLAYKSQLRPFLEDAYVDMIVTYNKRLPSMITLITGPSRTADIEKTLVLGAHGPKTLWVIIVDDNTRW
ncbi:LutC/YkgG family protein [Microbacter margulisiae]|uniref:L-lactate dehydrogenase complex protein LldG n=1 Tax=Microbacter margulisiae TaxID=1350067 RepID=A0A7W5H1E5_9PORP|nr:LUD domain-containing protein [Microbacter margulisiae]MBB3187503.1 L-lactate dehydrogenase complex protein LldG [Microbacter margulisiae]